MAVRDITSESEFNSSTTTLAPGALVTIFFHTPWAAPCKSMRTFFDALASQYPASDKTAFLAVDAEELPEISESFDVTAVPFVVLTRNGKILDSISGSNTARVRDAVEKEAGASEAGTKLPEKLDNKQHAPLLAEGTREAGHTQGENGSKDLSGYAPTNGDPKTGPEYSSKVAEQDTSDQTNKEDLNTRLAALVKAAPVMLFMKGTPSSPQCGFSRQTVAILREKGVRYGFFNILADDEVRQGLKEFSDCEPTFPQTYINGELIGGLDILKEELENDPDFLAPYATTPGMGGMAAPDQQAAPEAAAA